MKIPENFLDGEIRNSFYVERMMKRVWAAQLEVLHDVDALCRKHHIQYFADWGTLLGAVRHKGFIPWDDDMDITMKRPDYIRFCKIASEEMEGYDIINIHTDSTWSNMLTRIVNGRTISIDEDHLAKFHGCPWVIGLDIFPLDYVAPVQEEDELLCNMISIVGVLGQKIIQEENTEEECADTIKDIEKMCAVKFDYNRPLGQQLLELAENLGMMYTEQEASQIALMSDHAGPRPADVYPKELYADSIEMPFEYTTIPVPVGYHDILKQKYGEDYMVPTIGGGSHEYPFYKKQKLLLYEKLGPKIEAWHRIVKW